MVWSGAEESAPFFTLGWSRAMNAFHADVKARLEEMLDNMPSIEQAVTGRLHPSEQEGWEVGNTQDCRVNDVVFGMLLKAFTTSWLKWSGDHISEARDKEQASTATSMLITVLSRLGGYVSDTAPELPPPTDREAIREEVTAFHERQLNDCLHW